MLNGDDFAFRTKNGIKWILLIQFCCRLVSIVCRLLWLWIELEKILKIFIQSPKQFQRRKAKVKWFFGYITFIDGQIPANSMLVFAVNNGAGHGGQFWFGSLSHNYWILEYFQKSICDQIQIIQNSITSFKRLWYIRVLFGQFFSKLNLGHIMKISGWLLKNCRRR